MNARTLGGAAIVALSSAHWAGAQTSTFSTPGMPRARLGQTDRFSNEFNPALGVNIDALGAYLDRDEGDDGFDLELRAAELTANAYVDPNVWAYAVVVADEEEIALEEAAASWVGWEGSATLKAGRFFVDFGKQMQAHVHDLPTFDRPAVLRTYLGDELPGTGAQFDDWFALGDDTAVRYSLGIFQSLAPDAHAHGDEEPEEGPRIATPESVEADELSYTARITGFTDVGEEGVFQLGLSLRGLPEFSFDVDGAASETGLANHVFGLDATYGWTGESGLDGFTIGGEYLVATGDIGAEVDDAGTPGDPSDDVLSVLDDDAHGFYLWADYAWNAYNSFGTLWSRVEHPEPGLPSDDEVTVYYTRNLSEFSRLRLGVRLLDSDEGDETAFLVQWTNFLGPHAHGVNW